MIIYLENISGAIKQLHIHEFTIDEILEIDHTWYIDAVIEAVSIGDFQVRNQDGIIAGTAKQLEWLQGTDRVVEVSNKYLGVIPSSPKYEYGLRPYGLVHKHIDASTQIFDITLSNKSGVNIDFADCSVTPALYDCIEQTHSETRDGVYSVNGNALTTFMGRLSNGAATLIRPIDIDYIIETVEAVAFVYFWGLFFSAENFGEDDIVRLQHLDSNGAVVAEYDDCWVNQLDEIKYIGMPNNAPWEIATGHKLRIKYYPKDITKTSVKLWADYRLAIKEDA